jgi:hypothetical protein
MKQEQYSFAMGERRLYYEFYSIGPRGRIKKVVEFIRFKKLKTESYNLVFGDWDETESRINDLINTNNGDRDKVLATVASVVMDFMKEHPTANIFVTGSTPSRNRLYQIGIANALDEINLIYDIRGFIEGEWHFFERGVNYIAFLLKYK